MIYRFLIILLSILFAHGAFADDFVVSIKPLYGLVAKMIRGTDHKLHLLYGGASSPHTATLLPSDVVRLQKASLIFWVGPEYESQMVKYMRERPSAVTMTQVRGLLKFHNRVFEDFPHAHDDHDHGGGGCDHEHGDHHNCAEGHAHSPNEWDGHVWLHPRNAEMMLRAITKRLIHKDPKQADLYKTNLVRALFEIKMLFLMLKKQVKPKRYISFHDFSQYFDKTFGTQCINVVANDPHWGTSLHHFEKLGKMIARDKIDFLITEPQFKKDLLEKLSQEKIPIKTIDYIGTDVEANDTSYESILKNMAKSFSDF